MPRAAKGFAKKKKRKNDMSMPCRQYGKLYGTKKWKSIRLAHIYKYPLCIDCLKDNISKAAIICDHIIPHKGNVNLFYNLNNLQSLCKRHHDQKTKKEMNSTHL